MVSAAVVSWNAAQKKEDIPMTPVLIAGSRAYPATKVVEQEVPAGKGAGKPADVAAAHQIARSTYNTVMECYRAGTVPTAPVAPVAPTVPKQQPRPTTGNALTSA